MLPPELLDLLVLTLCQQAPAFTTSLSFAKLVTAVLTVCQSQVSEARLSSCSSWGSPQSSQVGSWQGSALSSFPPCQVTPAQRSSLAAVLDRSNAALKKSLQAVLGGAR